MQIIETIAELKKTLHLITCQNISLGLFGTNGGLHAGHLSIIKKAKEENDITAVVICQPRHYYNSQKEYQDYPANIEEDLTLLKSIQPNIVFIPNPQTMPMEKLNWALKIDYTFPKLAYGITRPEYEIFTIAAVSEIMEMFKPNKYYCGIKDYQLYVLLKNLFRYQKYNTEIILCPTIRDQDNLPYSSRNKSLTITEINTIKKIYPLLLKTKEKLAQNKLTINNAKQNIITEIKTWPNTNIVFVEIVFREDLQPAKKYCLNQLVILVEIFIRHVRITDSFFI